ncbi:hypothetical protein [Haloterrigena gelatinilytica]|uniref:hypothetical protein n=1 Tax=Haloterrigena gelatinilytica TaxID=2741724 RepID=UPI0020C6403F|nr:hypothetical protein [Haloterrigena gelatinilytica]
MDRPERRALVRVLNDLAFLLFGGLEVLVFGRFELLGYVGLMIGSGIGLTVAIPPLPLRTADA